MMHYRVHKVDVPVCGKFACGAKKGKGSFDRGKVECKKCLAATERWQTENAKILIIR